MSNGSMGGSEFENEIPSATKAAFDWERLQQG